ncbi:gliding motility lipoprotein GldH [Bacteroidota bacterium]
MRLNRYNLALVTVMVMLLSACGYGLLFDKNKEIPNKTWERSNLLRFDVEVEDSLASYDFYLNIRNEGTYPYSNLYMFINTTFPNGKSARDTVECILANASGRWLGNGLGDIWDNKILFKKNIRFPNTGIYKFEFEHGMRTKDLPSIIDVGMCIEPHKSK